MSKKKFITSKTNRTNNTSISNNKQNPNLHNPDSIASEPELFAIPVTSPAKAAERAASNALVLVQESKTLEDFLADDGVIIPQKTKVIEKKSKIGTEFSKKEVSLDSERQSPTIGRKTLSGSTSNQLDLKAIRKKFSFSWKTYSRKLALFLLIAGISGILIVSFVAAWLIDQYEQARPLSSINDRKESSVVYARDGQTVLFKLFSEERREVVNLCDPNLPLDKQAGNCIPKQMQLAIIALEDEKFYYNATGIPWTNMLGAAAKCLTSAGDDCRGASGISQQLVKNLTGDNESTINRKIRELFTAMKLNQENPHDKILDAYLNTVPFGRNAYGVQEAAKSYFDKDVKNISTPEACYLAALVQQPTTYSLSIEKKNTDEVDAAGRLWKEHWQTFENRKNICLNKLHTERLLPNEPEPFIRTPEELEALKKAEVKFIPNKIIFKYPHFVDFVREELKKVIPNERDWYEGGLRIVTTIDPNLQDKVEAIVASKIQSNVLNHNANNVAALVIDKNTGEILAMVGSRDYYNKDIDGQVNIITTPQQPGSSIKPYVYAAALAKDFNPGTIIIDKLTDFGGGYKPTNYGGNTGYGAVTIRYALQNSLNISAVKTAVYASGNGKYDPSGGINAVFDFAEKTGLIFPCIPSVDGDKCKDPQRAKRAYRERCFLAAALGGCEVTMLSHTTGINTLLNEGNLRTATPFISIESRSNPKLNEAIKQRLADLYPKKDAVIDPLVARQIANIMSDHSARLVFGPFGNNLILEGWPTNNYIAAKTGTSNDVRDVWTVGGTVHHTVTVWVGNTDNSPMKPDASSANAAGGIWKEIMKATSEGKEKKPFSTQGLRPYKVNCNGTTKGWCRENELLTDNQIKALQKGQQRLASNDFNPLESNIFEFRDEVLNTKVTVSKLDGKIAPESLPAAFKENKECLLAVSGFPKLPGWFQAAQSLDLGSNKCPTETSELTGPTSGLTVNAGGLASNSNAPTVINITATPTQPGGTMQSMKLIIDGVEKASGVDSITVNSNSLGLNGSFSVQIVAKDSFGSEVTLNFTNVTFTSTIPSDVDDVANIACTVTPNVCTITMDAGKLLPNNLVIEIGSVSTTCSSLTCTVNLPTTSGTYPIIGKTGSKTKNFGTISI